MMQTMKWRPSRSTLMLLRCAWIVAQLVMAAWMARTGVQFYYQGF